MNTIPLWISLIGFAAPLFAIAGSAIAYVIKTYRDASETRRSHFFELMKFIDSKQTIAIKVAAIYHLTQFPEHKDFIIRFCETQKQNITGGDVSTKALQVEMDYAIDAMKALK